MEHLEVLRLPDYIEHRYPERGLVEVWERDARGELSHWKVFDRLGRSVHYTPGDLRTIHLEPKWAELSTLRVPDEHGSARERTKFRLLKVQRCSAETCTKLNKASFRELEFADLGDSENDPFVRTFLARFSSGHTH